MFVRHWLVVSRMGMHLIRCATIIVEVGIVTQAENVHIPEVHVEGGRAGLACVATYRA